MRVKNNEIYKIFNLRRNQIKSSFNVMNKCYLPTISVNNSPKKQ